VISRGLSAETQCILRLIKGVQHQERDGKKQDCHDPTRLHKINHAIPSGAHDQSVYLMGWNDERIRRGNRDGQGEHGGVRSCGNSSLTDKPGFKIQERTSEQDTLKRTG